MQKLLIVDDDKALLGLLHTQLEDSYEVIETSDPTQAVGLALEHRPDAILMDLKMPGVSGVEVSQSLRTLSYTSKIPLVVMSGDFGTSFQSYSQGTGAKAFIAKPIDLHLLKSALDMEIRLGNEARRPSPGDSVVLELRGTDLRGNRFVTKATADNLSPGGFLCNSSAKLRVGSTVQVSVQGKDKGTAKVLRVEGSNADRPWYGFKFVEFTGRWVL